MIYREASRALLSSAKGPGYLIESERMYAFGPANMKIFMLGGSS